MLYAFFEFSIICFLRLCFRFFDSPGDNFLYDDRVYDEAFDFLFFGARLLLFLCFGIPQSLFFFLLLEMDGDSDRDRDRDMISRYHGL